MDFSTTALNSFCMMLPGPLRSTWVLTLEATRSTSSWGMSGTSDSRVTDSGSVCGILLPFLPMGAKVGSYTVHFTDPPHPLSLYPHRPPPSLLLAPFHPHSPP